MDARWNILNRTRYIAGMLVSVIFFSVEQYAARLRSELDAARKETEKLRVEAGRNPHRDEPPTPSAKLRPTSPNDTD